jgi:hypothetical protein
MKEEMVVGLSAPGPVGRWGAAPPQAMLERMKDYGQEGAFALWDDLSPEDRELLVRDIEVSSCNWSETLLVLLLFWNSSLPSSEPYQFYATALVLRWESCI